MAFYGDTLTFDMRSLAAGLRPQFSTLGFRWVSDCLCGQAAHLPYTLGSQMPTVRRLLRPHVAGWDSPENGRLRSDPDECSQMLTLILRRC